MIRAGLTLAALVTVAFLSGCASTSKPSAGELGRLDARPRVDEKRCPEGNRWLSSDPHVPLAVSRPGELLEAGAGCCELPARGVERFSAVDAWGRLAGTAEVTGSEFNQASGCHELELRTVEGAPGVLYASPGYRGSPSFAWQPSPAEHDSLRALVANLDALLSVGAEADALAEAEPSLEWPVRVRFFTTPGRNTGDVPLYFAFVGGRAPLIARRAGAARWNVEYLDVTVHASGYSAYTPIAILDMTADGRPEVVVLESSGPMWADIILQFDNESGLWRRVVESPGGSTI